MKCPIKEFVGGGWGEMLKFYFKGSIILAQNSPETIDFTDPGEGLSLQRPAPLAMYCSYK